MIEKYYEVTNPALGQSSATHPIVAKLQFKTFERALQSAQSFDNHQSQIYAVSYIRLPFGWGLERSVRLTRWSDPQ